MATHVANLCIALSLALVPALADPATPPKTVVEGNREGAVKTARKKLAECQAKEAKAKRLFELGVICRKQWEDAAAETKAADAALKVLQAPKKADAEPKQTANTTPKPVLPSPGSPVQTESLAQAPAIVDERVKALRDELADAEVGLTADEALLDETLGRLKNDLAEHDNENELHRLAASARRFVGARYRWGGATSRGFDCSGLIQRLLQMQRVSAPRTAAGLFGVGTPVKKEELRSGDLVFFKDTYKPGISHVGVYVADGEFIHASGVDGGVKVSKLSETRYAEHYAGARRLLP